jgi:hypothetical protein
MHSLLHSAAHQKKAAENNRPLLAPENFQDDPSYQRRRVALNEGQNDDIVKIVSSNCEHQNMQVGELQHQPFMPKVSVSMMQQASYNKG